MTEQEQAAALADEIEQECFDNDPKERVPIRHMRARWNTVINALRAYARPAPALVDVQAAALSAAVDAKLCEMRAAGEVFTLGRVGDLTRAAHDKGAELRLAPAPADLRGVMAKAVAYAEQLATDLHAKHFPDVTQWRLLSGDLVGILTQIDNMTVGLATSRPPRAGDDLGNGLVAVLVEPRLFVLTEEFCGSVKDLAKSNWNIEACTRLYRAMLAAAKEG